MKTKIISPIGLSITGAGPKIMRSMLAVIIVGIVAKKLFPAFATIPWLEAETLKNAGWILTSFGIVMWICAVVQFLIGFPKGKLITTGFYSLSRNPIYSCWIILILPGLAALCNNWIFLLSALVMYFSLLINIEEEEKALTETFGDEYIDYAQRVNRVFFTIS